MKKNNKIELRSEEFQEILGRIPSWMLRYGLTLIGGFLLLLLIGSAVFKYPDTISTTMTLTGTYPPAALVAKTSGRLQKVYVTNNQEVKAGEYLAVIENPARENDVLSLKKYLGIYSNHLDTVIIPLPPKDLKLGSIQSLYSSYYTTLFELNEFIRMQYYPQKIKYTRKQLSQLKEYYSGLLKQAEIVWEQASLSTKQYIRDLSLHKEKLISDETIETSKSNELQGKLSMESMNTNIRNTNIQITRMEENLLDMEYQYQDKKNTLGMQLKTYTTQLITEIKSWEQNYVLTAPFNGKVAFTRYWTKDQQITSGDIVFNVVPLKGGELIGKATMEMSRSGKVKPGQKVNIHFLNFDENEYGTVKGIVKTISLVPVQESATNSSHYIVEISLPEGLKTTYKKRLPYYPEMQAQADIITEDLSVLERFFMPIKKIWKRGMEN